MKKCIPILLISIILLSACTQARLESLPTIVNTNTPVNIPAFTPTIINTLIPTIAPTITATPDRYTRIERTYPSPDGKWNANFYGLDILKLYVINEQENLMWVYVDENPQYHLETILKFISWSNDSRYLFFNQYVYFDGFVPYYDGQGLKRLDTKTGQILDILPILGKDMYYLQIDTIGVSSSGDKIVYSDYQDKKHSMVIQDLISGKKEHIYVSSSSGEFTWSLDETRVLFLQYSGDDWNTLRTNILVYDLNNHEIQTLLSDVERIIRPQKWLDDNTVLFYEWENKYYFLNVTTGELIFQPDYEDK